MSLRVRAAEQEDLDAIEALIFQVEEADVVDADSDLDATVVAELDGAIVGLAVARRSRRSWQIVDVLVAPLHRRKGVGRALVDSLASYEHAPLGCLDARAELPDPEPQGARRLLCAAGFQPADGTPKRFREIRNGVAADTLPAADIPDRRHALMRALREMVEDGAVVSEPEGWARRTSKPWTSAHEREAAVWWLEMAARDVRANGVDPSVRHRLDRFASEPEFAQAVEDAWEVDPEPVIRRVRDFAEGRLVRIERVLYRWLREDGTVAARWRGTASESERLRGFALSNAASWRRAGCRLVRRTRTIVRRAK